MIMILIISILIFSLLFFYLFFPTFSNRQNAQNQLSCDNNQVSISSKFILPNESNNSEDNRNSQKCEVEPEIPKESVENSSFDELKSELNQSIILIDKRINEEKEAEIQKNRDDFQERKNNFEEIDRSIEQQKINIKNLLKRVEETKHQHQIFVKNLENAQNNCS